jgi:hypothetical protein
MENLDNVVINLATPTSWYKEGQKRLFNSLIVDNNFDGGIFFKVGEDSIGCKTHQQIPYGFKPKMFLLAKERGYKNVLWCDCSVWAVKDISAVFEIIEKKGHFMLKIGEKLGRWTNDFALNYFNIKREDATEHPMFMAGLFGLNLENKRSLEFLELWDKSSEDGAFNGSWADHRHDLSCGSIIAKRLEMDFIEDIYGYACYIGSCYGEPDKRAMFYLQGM